MQTDNPVIKHCQDSGLYVGHVPGIPGAHSQGETLEELNVNLQEVISMIHDDGSASVAGGIVCTQAGTENC